MGPNEHCFLCHEPIPGFFATKRHEKAQNKPDDPGFGLLTADCADSRRWFGSNPCTPAKSAVKTIRFLCLLVPLRGQTGSKRSRSSPMRRGAGGLVHFLVREDVLDVI